MMQGLLLLPAFALAYLVAGRSGLWSRIWHLLVAGAAVVVSGGWYVLLVALWPADSRPYIGGSQTNSLWELAIGYNGLSRIFGGSGNVGGAIPGGAGGFGGRRDGSSAAAGGTTAQGALPDDLAEAIESGQIPAGIAEMLESGELPTGAP